MKMTEKKQKWLNKFGTMMLCYSIVSIVMLFMRGWDKFDIAFFLVNIINYIGFRYIDIELYQTGIIAIVIGLLSFFMLPGLLIEVFGIILTIYSGICLAVYYKK